MKNWIEKNKRLILIVFCIIFMTIIIGTLLLYIKNKQKLKVEQIDNDNYLMKYDSTWKVEEKNDTAVKLSHKQSKSQLNIRITELELDIQYKTLEELFNRFLDNIQEQNKEYNLLNKEEIIINNTNLKGYKLLFENDTQQVEIIVYKQGTKLVTITYEATYEYFDLVLNSAKYIIENFTLKEKKFDVSTEINLKTEKINYTNDNSVRVLLKTVKPEEITAKNYRVNYTIPSNFVAQEQIGENAYYTLEGLDIGKNLSINVNIFNTNIYEYLDKESYVNIYNTRYYLNDDIKVTIDKYSETPLCYIYRDSYKVRSMLYENIELIFEINADHIFSVSIKSTGVGIPRELVDMIKINKIENYATEN